MTQTSDPNLSAQGRIALALALLGYLPFFALMLAVGPLNPMLAGVASVFALPSWFFAHVLAVYSAVILSFLGGIRWGVAMVGTGDAKIRLRELTWSIVPSLAGWAAVFMPRSEGLFFLSACFVVQGYWDMRLASAGRAPNWFHRLRLILTILVCATLINAGILA